MISRNLLIYFSAGVGLIALAIWVNPDWSFKYEHLSALGSRSDGYEPFSEYYFDRAIYPELFNLGLLFMGAATYLLMRDLQGINFGQDNAILDLFKLWAGVFVGIALFDMGISPKLHYLFALILYLGMLALLGYTFYLAYIHKRTGELIILSAIMVTFIVKGTTDIFPFYHAWVDTLYQKITFSAFYFYYLGLLLFKS